MNGTNQHQSQWSHNDSQAVIRLLDAKVKIKSTNRSRKKYCRLHKKVYLKIQLTTKNPNVPKENE